MATGHQEKQYASIIVTDEGMVSVLKLLHPLNAETLIEFNDDGMVGEVKLLQFIKAQAPIEIILFGRTMLLRLPFELNAASGIVCIG